MTAKDLSAEMTISFEIGQKLNQFARLVDTKEFDSLGQVFVDEIVGIYNGAQGHDTLEALIASMHLTLGANSLCAGSQHNVLNLTVTGMGENWAESRAYFYAVQQGRGEYEGQFWKTWGEYNDVWASTPEGWRIARRNYTTFFSEGPQEIVGGKY